MPAQRLHLSGEQVAFGLLLFFGGATLLLNPSRLGGDRLFSRTVVIAIIAVSAAAFALTLLTFFRSPSRRFAALGVLVIATVVLPTLAFVLYRIQTGVPIHVQDGSYQTEIAAARLLSGHDPYGTDFTQTDMARWPMYTAPDLNAGLHHYPYSPLTILFAVPAAAISALTGLPPDLRPWLLLVGGLAFWMVVTLPWSWPTRYVLLTLLFLDPLLFWQDGRNDVLWLTALIAAVALAARRRWVLAFWAIGVSAAFKVFALPLVPLAALLLFVWCRPRRLPGRATAFALAGLLLPLGLTVIPFVLWSPAAFFGDTVGFTSIAGAHGYPIRGYGLSELLLALGILTSPYAAFPFGLLEAAVGAVLLPVAALIVVARPRLSAVLDGGAAVIAAVLFCALQFSDNYVASLLVLFALAIGSRPAEAVDQPAALQAA